MNEHPSYLGLDRYAAGDEAPEIARHVAACGRCRAHVEQVRGADEPPAWVRDLPAPVVRLRPRRRMLAAGAAIAAAAAVAIVVGRPDPYVGPKGDDLPSVALRVRRGETTFLWNGEAPLQPGDRVRLEIAPAGRTFLVVASGEPPATLWSGPVAGPSFVVPGSFELDAAPGPERVVVALTEAPLSPDEIRRLPAAPDGAWVTTLSIEKRP